MPKNQHTIKFLSIILCLSLLIATNSILAETSETQLTLSEKVYDVEWSPDGSLIAAAGADGVSLYTPDLRPIFHSKNYLDVISVSWNPHGTQFASGGKDGAIKIWNYDQQDDAVILYRSVPVNEGGRFYLPVAWSPDGTKLASIIVYQPQGCLCAVGSIKIWNTSDWTLTTSFSDEISFPLPQLLWNPDSTILAGAGNVCNHEQFGCENSSVYTANLESEEVRSTSRDFANISSLDWSANGGLADAGSGISIYDGGSLQLTRYWDIDGSLFIEPMYISWNQDGTKMAIGNKSGLASLIDIATGKVLETFETRGITDLDWSPSGKQIVIGGDQSLTVWNVTELPAVVGIPTATYFPTVIPASPSE